MPKPSSKYQTVEYCQSFLMIVYFSFVILFFFFFFFIVKMDRQPLVSGLDVIISALTEDLEKKKGRPYKSFLDYSPYYSHGSDRFI